MFCSLASFKFSKPLGGFVCALLLFGAGGHCVHAAPLGPKAAPEAMPTRWQLEPPRILSLLEKAWAIEKGHGAFPDPQLALAFYCEAARYGSAEGHLHSALLLSNPKSHLYSPAEARGFWSHANELGHAQAELQLAGQARLGQEIRQHRCLTDQESYRASASFDHAAYLKGLSAQRRQIAELVMRLAPEYQVDGRLALAIASAESNFNPNARSPKNAQGVMQLIPETASRFQVKNIWDPEENIRGGLAYLRWLSRYFSGDIERIAAAYNAGEGAVVKYGGVPPFFETRAYVWRVVSSIQGRSHQVHR